MLYFAVGAFDYSGGVVVSASHNPKEYNGMKMVKEKAAAISSDTGLFDIRDALKAGKDAEVTSDKKGTCTERDILDDYLAHVLKSIDRNVIKEVYVCRECELWLCVQTGSEARGGPRPEPDTFELRARRYISQRSAGSDAAGQSNGNRSAH